MKDTLQPLVEILEKMQANRLEYLRLRYVLTLGAKGAAAPFSRALCRQSASLKQLEIRFISS